MRISPSCRTAIAALVMAGSAMSAAHAEVTTDARTLVLLRKPHERQAQAIRFMLAVSPFGETPGLAECAVQKAEAPLVSYFESLYAAQLSKEELRQAVLFYGSRQGQEAVRLRLKYEQDIMASAQRGEQVTESGPPYPADVREALGAFTKTSAGRHFAGEEMEDREPFRSEASDLRSVALGQCLTEKAK